MVVVSAASDSPSWTLPYAEMLLAVYQRRIEREAKRYGARIAEREDGFAAEAVLLEWPDEDRCCLLVPGTRAWDVVDILADLFAWPGAKVHSGIFLYFGELWFRFAKSVRSYAERIVVGHSQGGAVATLWACFDEEATALAFGPPRPGDRHVVRDISERSTVTVVVTSGDPVPRLPPKWFGYEPWPEHVVRKVDTGRTFCPLDHRMDTYVEHLRKKARGDDTR